MAALFRLIVVGFIVLTVIYVILSIWSRLKQRKRLEAEWVEEGMTGEKDAFVDQGLKEYDGSLRRKLILGVYIVPVVVISTIVYMTNFM